MMQEISVDNVALKVKHVMLAKERPTLVFLHDSLGCTRLWRDFPEALGHATHCNVLVYDRQGYGESPPFAPGDRQPDYLEKEANVLHHLLEQAGIASAILFGHSDGGSIALIAAAKYPAVIKAIITEGAHIFVEQLTLDGIRNAAADYRTTDLGERLQKYHGEKTDALFSAWAKTWFTEVFRHWNIEHFLPAITCPVLVIQGESDEFGTLRQVEGIVSQVGGKAEKLVVPGTGHTPHKDARAIVLQKATEFIRSL